MVRSRSPDGAAATRPFQVLNAAGSKVLAPDWLAERDRRPAADEAQGIVLVLVDDNEQLPVGLIGRLQQEVTILIFGPAKESDWRRQALAAGAFACMSPTTPLEDRDGLLFAAIKHQAVRAEIQGLRQEAERVCLELVKSFASATEKLGLAKLENQRVLEALEGARMRILRTLI